MPHKRDTLHVTADKDGLVQDAELWSQDGQDGGDADDSCDRGYYDADCRISPSEDESWGQSEGESSSPSMGAPGNSSHRTLRSPSRGSSGNPGPDTGEGQTVCMRHTIVVREHTASWLGIAIVGGYIAITLFVAGRAAFIASAETEMLQVLEQLHQNFGSAIGFVLGYYFATRANGSSNGSKGPSRRN